MSGTDFIRHQMDGLNASQREAAMHGKGPALVLAGPGSGKTTVIVHRLYFMIQQLQIPPERILVVTFTKEAALSMQRRFFNFSKVMFPVCFGTFHSIFFQILKQSHYFTKSYTILNAEQKNSLLQSLLKKSSFHNGGFSNTFSKEEVSDLLKLFEYYKNTGNRELAAKLCPSYYKDCWYSVLEQYCAFCAKKQLLDFEDMIYLCRRMFSEREDIRDYWRRRFPYLLVDEFQDINPQQYEVMKSLALPGKNLFVVGDDDQSIYGFRGAEPECMKKFVQEMDAKILPLSINYRSTSAIVSFAGEMIAPNKLRFSKNIQAQSVQGAVEPVQLHLFSTKEKEIEWLTGLLKEVSCAGKEVVGVLFRTRSNMQLIANALTAENINFSMREKLPGFGDHFICRDILSYLKLAAGKGNKADLLRIMNKPFRGIGREAVAELEAVAEAETVVEADIVAISEATVGWETEEKLNKLWKSIQKMQGMSPHLAIDYIFHALRYREYAEHKLQKAGQGEDWREIAKVLKKLALCCADVEELEAAIQKFDSRGAPDSCIRLMTVHAAKGLEFDRVFLPDCNEKVFPYGVMQEEALLEEERRIFYVAVTRAKKSLELLAVTGTPERPRQISRFLNFFPRKHSEDQKLIIHQ